MNKQDVFSFGQCKACGKHTALKNGYCNDCGDKTFSTTDFNFDDIFNTIFKDNSKGK